MKLFICLLISSEALACSVKTPAGFEPSAKPDTYVNKDKSVSISVKCDFKISVQALTEALGTLGPAKVERSVHYVDLAPGSVRAFIATEPVQLTAVAKTPEALEKATPAIIESLNR